VVGASAAAPGASAGGLSRRLELDG